MHLMFIQITGVRYTDDVVPALQSEGMSEPIIRILLRPVSHVFDGAEGWIERPGKGRTGQ
jgi:hypothetical protein